MSDPGRLLDGEAGTDLERELLASARGDAPGPHARRRTLAALGLGGAIVGASATAASTTAASTAGLSLLKWIGFGVVSGVVFVAGVSRLDGPAEPPPAPPAVTAPAAVANTARPAPGGELAEPPPDETADAPDAPAKTPEPAGAEPRKAPGAPQPAAAAAPREAGPGLADEVRLLDQAREALAGKDAAAALDALEKHDRGFAGGALAPEAEVLRIEATLAKGDRVRAAALAREFLAKHPESPHASRVRSLLSAAGGEGG